MRSRTIVLIFTFCVSLIIFGFVTDLIYKAEAQSEAIQSKSKYTLEVTAKNKSELPNKAKKALEKALNQRWRGVEPKGGVFYLPDFRSEKNWALATIFFYENGVEYEEEGESPLANAFMMMVAKDNKGEWIAARADEFEANDVTKNIPDSAVSPVVKSQMLFQPSIELKNSVSREFSLNNVAQNSTYKLPWDRTVNDFVITRVWHGNGSSSWGAKSMHAVDLARAGNADILSPVNGTVHVRCMNTGSKQKQGMLAIKVSGGNDVINIWHLDRTTVPSDLQIGSVITQGQYLGRMVEGTVYESSPCPLNSAGTHLHLVFPYKPMNIDNYQFNTNGSVKYLVNNSNVGINSTKMISTNQKGGSCTPPSSGTWTITQDCILSSSRSFSGDLIINAGKSLTLSNNVTLDMDLKNYKIVINHDSKLVIQNGARIT